MLADRSLIQLSLSEPDKYRGRCLQPTIGLSIGSPMEELEKGLEELKRFATPQEEQYQPIRPARIPRDKTTNQRVNMELPMASAAQVAEDVLVGHQWEVRLLVL